MDELLTDAEHQAVRDAGLLFTHIVRNVIGDGPTRDGDIAEMVHHIHGIQHAIMAQAAARRYPGRYRLLGDVLTGGVTIIDDPQRTPQDATSPEYLARVADWYTAQKEGRRRQGEKRDL